MNFSFLLRLAATRMRSRAYDASARPCVRDVLCGIAFPSVPALGSTCSVAGMPVLFAGFTATSAKSDFSRPFIVGYGSSPSRRDPATQAPRMAERSPGSRTKSFRTCQGLRPRRAVGTLALSRSAMSPSVGIKTSAPRISDFRGSMAGLCAPLPTLRLRPRERKRTAWGRCGSLLLHRIGLEPITPCRSPGAQSPQLQEVRANRRDFPGPELARDFRTLRAEQ